MGKQERKALVLKFMAEYDLALPPSYWFRNLKLHQNITFSQDTVENYLDEYVEEGLVQRIEKEPLESGDIILADDDYKRAAYVITDAGRKKAAEL